VSYLFSVVRKGHVPKSLITTQSNLIVFNSSHSHKFNVPSIKIPGAIDEGRTYHPRLGRSRHHSLIQLFSMVFNRHTSCVKSLPQKNPIII
jgi:hypothetical protein